VDLFSTILSHFNGRFPGGPRLAGTRMPPFWISLDLQMMEVVSGDNWSYNTYKAPVKSSTLTNQYPGFYRPDAHPVTQPTVSKHWMEIIQHDYVNKTSTTPLTMTRYTVYIWAN